MTFRMLILICLLATLSGCSGDESDSATVAREAIQFNTPEAVLSEVERLLSRQPPDTMGYLALVYTENELQERMLRWQRAIFEAEQIKNEALAQQFGRWTSVDDPFPPWPIDEMRMIESDGARARAECISHARSIPFERPGGTSIMHLVRVGDRWWSSAYSYEYDDDWNHASLYEDAELRKYESIGAERSDGAREFANAVRSGRYGSLEAAEEAWLDYPLSDE